MKFQKKTFIIFILLFLVVVIPPAVVLPIVFKQRAEINIQFDQNNLWNIAKFKEEIQDQKNSIVYFGASKCPACRRFKEETENSSQLKKNFEEVKKKLDQETIWIGYYDDLELDSKEKEDFSNQLNEILGDMKKEDDSIRLVGGTPHVLFMKKGKIVAQLEGGECTVDKIIEESEKAYLDKK